MFYRRNQKEYETFEKYVNEIKTMSKKCKFESITTDQIIRDNIINGMKNDGLRKALITKDNLTCTEIIRICRAEDLSLEQHSILRKKEVNYIDNYKGKKSYNQVNNKDKKCIFCGKNHNFKKVLYPAYGKTCTKCGRKNHFKIMCKSEVTEKVQSVFTISMNVNNVKTIDQLPKCETITLKTEWGTLIQFQIDKGVAVNIIPISIYETASKDYKHK